MKYKELGYFFHSFKNGKYARVLLIETMFDGAVIYFVVRDFCKAVGINYPKNLKSKIGFCEMIRCGVDGQAMNLVTASGLIGIIPRGNLHFQVREYAIELISACSTQKEKRTCLAGRDRLFEKIM